jgi:PKD repeat protein
MVRISRVLIAVAAAGLLVSACTVKKTERPALTGPSELALSLSLSANPDILAADGSAQSHVVVLARDQNGQAISGLPLHVEIAVNGVITAFGQLSSQDVTTGSDGRATVNYTAPFLENGETVTILVTPTGADYANAVPRSVSIRLVPTGWVPPRPTASYTYSPAVPVPNSAVTFDGSASGSPSGTIVTYSWDFGDSSTGTGVKPQHTYRAAGDYQVTLVVVDDQGWTSYPYVQTVTVAKGEAPVASFVFSPSAPIPLQTIFFNASTSTPGTGRTLTDYGWNFGNGSTQHGLTASTSYGTVGSYNVTLVVTDDVGQTASKSQSVTVSTGTPTAAFVSSVVGLTVYVDASTSAPSAGQTITDYEWVFGDSTSIDADHTRVNSHPYANPGAGKSVTYTVTLTVTDSGGGRKTVSGTVTITGF